MSMFNRGWGNGWDSRNGGGGYVNGAVNGADMAIGASTQAQVANLSDQMRGLAGQIQDNHNTDLTNSNITRTQDQIGNLSTMVGGGFANVAQDINGVERVTSGGFANLMQGINGGFANMAQDINGVQSAVQTTGCGIKSAILEQGYQNQLANCQQTNTILQQSQNLQNTAQNGFTQVGFQIERNACGVKENSTANTQKILDTLNNHWQLESQTTIQQLRDQVGRLEQTNQLIAALTPAAAAYTKAASSPAA